MTLFALTTGKNLDRQLKGNFDPVEKPVLNSESVLSKTFQQNFETYFHNSFIGRGCLVTTYNQIRHSLFDENPLSCVGDSLIHEPYIIAHMGIDPYNYNDPKLLSEMENYVGKLQIVSDLLRDRGKSFIVVTAAGKAAYFEEDIPQRYYLMSRGLGAADCLDNIIRTTDVLYLNCDQYLSEIDFRYPVFYKSSHHWSRTAEIEIENAIFDIINRETPFSVETYDIRATIESSVPIDRDADTEELMNLWFSSEETYYTYEIDVNLVQESTNICIQGDSFTSLIARDLFENGHSGIVSNIDYDNAYYVNNECVSLLGHDFSTLDIDKIVSENDIFIIVYTDYNIPGYGYGFIDALYSYLNGITGGL